MAVLSALMARSHTSHEADPSSLLAVRFWWIKLFGNSPVVGLSRFLYHYPVLRRNSSVTDTAGCTAGIESSTGARDFLPDRLQGPPSLLFSGYSGLLRGLKTTGWHGADHCPLFECRG
jgi:hypothetical protein